MHKVLTPMHTTKNKAVVFFNYLLLSIMFKFSS
jgi:hypothetical protein